jgi:hypothetical protein
MKTNEIDCVGVPEHDRGYSMALRSGGRFFLTDPSAADILIEDIAGSLSKLCRFTGHLTAFYSVAQHSVIVSHLVPPRDSMWGLLHDASEAFIGDIGRPLKLVMEHASPGVLIEIENRIHRAIAERFGLPWPMPHSIKIADNIALATERRDLLPFSTFEWPNMPDPCGEKIEPWLPITAEAVFLDRFIEISGR